MSWKKFSGRFTSKRDAPQDKRQLRRNPAAVKGPPMQRNLSKEVGSAVNIFKLFDGHALLGRDTSLTKATSVESAVTNYRSMRFDRSDTAGLEEPSLFEPTTFDLTEHSIMHPVPGDLSDLSEVDRSWDARRQRLADSRESTNNPNIHADSDLTGMSLLMQFDRETFLLQVNIC